MPPKSSGFKRPNLAQAGASLHRAVSTELIWARRTAQSGIFVERSGSVAAESTEKIAPKKTKKKK